MSEIVKHPRELLQNDDSITSTLHYKGKIAVCKKCLLEGNVVNSVGFYQDNCHICNTEMTPLKMVDRKVEFVEKV